MSFLVDREFKNLIPPLSGEEFAQLEASILSEGVRDPLVLWTNNGSKPILVEGHHRWQIVRKHKITKYRILKKKFDDRDAVRCWIIDNQCGRRNLPRFTKCFLQILKLQYSLRLEAKKNQGTRTDLNVKSPQSSPLNVDGNLAKAAGVSRQTIQRVRYLGQHGDKETLSNLQSGDLSINMAFQQVRAKVKRLSGSSSTGGNGSEGGIVTAIIDNNADLMKEVAELYLKKGMRVAVVTWGKGVFWREVDVSQFDFHPSDIHTSAKFPFDFRDLPYEKDSFDVLILDPPYAHNPGSILVDDNYAYAATTARMYHSELMELYRDGMKEAKRVLKKGGLLMVKCQDEIESSSQRRSHMEIYGMAMELGMKDEDLFLLVQPRTPVIQQKEQQHARKNHSFL